MTTFTTTNPYTLESNGTFTRHTNEELDVIIQTAHEAYLDWRTQSFSQRQELFLKLADLIDAKHETLAELETREMWRLYHVATKGIKGTANLIRWYANNAERILGDEAFEHDGLVGKYKYDSLWVIYWIAPWNFPFNQVLRAAVANIAAGNTTVYKHSSNCPLAGQAIEDLFTEAGFPQGIYTNIYSSWSQSEHIIANKHIVGVNLTWWERAGAAVGSLAGKYLKPSVLELWGNDAFVVLDHTDTDAMVANAVACRINNWGQRCNGSKRFIVLEQYYDAFVEKMWAYMSNEVIRWDPMDASTTLPPLSSSDQVAEVADQVTRSIADGARLVTGWEILGDKGQFYAPTLLADVTPGMTSYREELFGPVASVIKAKDIDHAIQMANDSDFWLSATVWGDDIETLKTVADKLDGGMIFINNPAWSKASLPFGWVRKSGYGKENGPEGLRSFTNKKAIVYSIK